MIKSITLNNYQGHKDSELSFSPYVNVITGLSMRGKTAIIRGLNWVVNNRPSGDKHKRRGAKDYLVEVVVEKNDKAFPIVRYRDKSHNIYKIDEIVYEAMKTEVPDDVTKLLNFNEFNIQNQHDSHFLIFESPQKIAATIDEVSNLTIAKPVQKHIENRRREVNRDIKRTEEDIKETEKALQHPVYGNLWNIKLKHWEYIRIGKELAITEEKLADLKKRKLDADRIDEEIKEHEDTIVQTNYPGMSMKMKKLERLEGELEEADEELEELAEFQERLAEFNERMKKENDNHAALSKEHDAMLKKLDVCPTCYKALTPEEAKKLAVEN